MIKSSNGNIFRVAQRPVTRSFDVFFDLNLTKPLSKQWWGWWFETPSCPLWRHRNGRAGRSQAYFLWFRITNALELYKHLMRFFLNIASVVCYLHLRTCPMYWIFVQQGLTQIRGLLLFVLWHENNDQNYDDVIKWNHFPRYWPFVRGIHRSPVNSPHKDQWRGALMFSLICTWINGWVNKRKAGDLRRRRTH